MSMKTFFGIEIPKRNAQCANAEEELNPGEQIYSVINLSEDVFLRDDFCENCWSQVKGEDRIKKSITHWKSIVPEKKVEEKENFLDRDQKALALLKKMASSSAIEEQHQAYILGLFLARRRQVYNRKEFKNENDEAAILFEIASSNDVVPVRKFEFSDLDVAAIQKILAKKLKD